MKTASVQYPTRILTEKVNFQVLEVGFFLFKFCITYVVASKVIDTLSTLLDTLLKNLPYLDKSLKPDLLQQFTKT